MALKQLFTSSGLGFSLFHFRTSSPSSAMMEPRSSSSSKLPSQSEMHSIKSEICLRLLVALLPPAPPRKRGASACSISKSFWAPPLKKQCSCAGSFRTESSDSARARHVGAELGAPFVAFFAPSASTRLGPKCGPADGGRPHRVPSNSVAHRVAVWAGLPSIGSHVCRFVWWKSHGNCVCQHRFGRDVSTGAKRNL